MQWKDIEAQVASIDGWLLPGQDRWLLETAQATPEDAVILEIGGYLGRSTAALGFACIGTARHVYCIDTFNGNGIDFREGKEFEGAFFDTWLINMNRLGLAHCVTALVGKSSAYYDHWTLPLDMLFIDGSHQYADALGDLCNFSQHVKPGGIVAMHDVNPLCPWPGPYRAWCEMSNTLLESTWVTCGTLAYGFKM